MALIITNLKECERLWAHWTKHLGHDGFFDQWDVRMCFFDPAHHTLHFIVGDNDEWMVPLWHDKTRDLYEFFGGELPEPNHVFISKAPRCKVAVHLRDIARQLPPWTYLEYLDNTPSELRGLVPMDDHERYVLHIKGMRSFEDYLQSFSGKHRKNLQRDLRVVGEHVTTHKDHYPHLAKLGAMNRERFGKDSSFHNAHEENGFMRLCSLAHENGWLHSYSLTREGKVIAVQPAVFYHRRYTVLSGGADLRIANCGKLLLALHIKNALALGATVVDFMSHDSGWKKLWNLEAIPQYEYTNEEESEADEKK